mgnify:CR=1 FL=1
MENIKERLFAELKELTGLHGASGFEQPVVKRLYESFKPLVDEVFVDPMGNLYAVKKGTMPGPNSMVIAHSDEVASVVKSVDARGFLRIGRLFGQVEPLLVGRKVAVKGRFGVIGVKPGHLQDEQERQRTPKYQELYVDVGAKSAQEVQKMGIGIGDPVTYISELDRFTNPDLVCGKALDDRLGCAVLLELLRQLQEKEFPGTFYAVVSVQEEVGLRGAQVATYRVNPDFAYVLDTVPCGGTPDVPEAELPIDIGKGPVFPLVSGGFIRGNIMQAGMRNLLIKTAEAHDISYQLATVCVEGGTSDVSTVHLVREGIPTGVIAIPRRYSHSPIETADLNDALAALALLQILVSVPPAPEEIAFFA